MKNFIAILALLLSAQFAYAQDTIVKKNGMVMPGFIVESDSAMISFSKTDSTAKELNLIQRTELLFIKHRDGNVERLYQFDTLVTTNGDFVLCKVLEISPAMVISFSYSGKVSEPVAMPTANIFMVRFHDGSRQLMSDFAPISGEKYYELGMRDAVQYYSTDQRAVVGEVITGATTVLCWPMIFVGTANAKKEPRELHNAANPNDHLLNSNSDYEKGYREAARQIKKKKCNKVYLQSLGAAAGVWILLLVAGG